MNYAFTLLAIDGGISVLLVIAIITAIGALYGINTKNQQLRGTENEIKLLAEENESKAGILKSREEIIHKLESSKNEIQAKLDQMEGQTQLLKEELLRKDVALEKKNDELTESRLEKLNYELSPHAFKNTLNTIHGMAYRMELATKRFSKLLDYMLYDTKKKQVKMAEELDFLEKYIALNELMISPWVTITKDFSGIEDGFKEKWAVAPLITIYFAENAFKHALLNDKECFIKFTIKNEGEDKIVYTVSNKRHVNKPPPKKSGVGSVNLNQRLELLYKDRYTLESRPIEDLFVASLTLTLEPYENPVPIS